MKPHGCVVLCDSFPIVVFSALCSLFPQQPAFVTVALQKKRPGCVFGVSIGFILVSASYFRCFELASLHSPLVTCIYLLQPPQASLHWLVLHSAFAGDQSGYVR